MTGNVTQQNIVMISFFLHLSCSIWPIVYNVPVLSKHPGLKYKQNLRNNVANGFDMKYKFDLQIIHSLVIVVQTFMVAR